MRALVLVCLCACSGDGGTPVCTASPDAGLAGLFVSIGANSTAYKGLKWGANNDCPAAGSSVVSVTIIGEQVGSGGQFGIALCLPRPDLIRAAAIDLADATMVKLESLTGELAGCMFTKDGTPTGTITFSGFCAQAGATYVVALAGQVPATSRCSPGGPTNSVTLVLSGDAVVVPR
ncbi:MAG TPA: hypothetical protein VKE22_02090 [Haliangiales bacterium]|nr:hypothetical protein [Haliangiales bacterium]